MIPAAFCFWFGFLELGFVLASAGVLPAVAFLAWSGTGCVALMLPAIKTRWAKRRPPTGATGGYT